MTPWIFSLIVAFGLLATPVLAQETDSTTDYTSTAEQVAKEVAKQRQEKLREQNKLHRDARKAALEAAKTARNDKKLEAAKDLADKLISERTELLKKLSSGEHASKCRAAAKADVVTAVDSAIARLGQIDTDAVTTTEQIRTLIKNDIVGNNRVYVGLLPAVRGMCVSDRLIGTIETKLMPLVDRIEANGSDVTEIQTELEAAVSDAEQAYAAYKAIANNPGSTSYKTDLSAAKDLIKNAKTHLSAAREAISAFKTTSESLN